MTTRLVRDGPSYEKSTRLLEMSGGERLRKKRVLFEVVMSIHRETVVLLLVCDRRVILKR